MKRSPTQHFPNAPKRRNAMQVLQKPIDWRDCEFVSLSNAARIAGRSPTWVRGAICTGDLEGVRLPTGGPEVVTVASLVALLERAERIRQRAEGVRGNAAPHLSLVHSN